MTPTLLRNRSLDGPVVYDIRQRTDDWHLWRQHGYGGSDAVNLWTAKWKTPREIHQQKLGMHPDHGYRSEPTPAMLRGIALEPLARSLLESALQQSYPPACVQHPQHPFLLASVDGLRRRGRHRRIIELKVANRDDFALVKAGMVPAHLMYQVRHNLITAVADVCAFGALWQDDQTGESDFAFLEVAYSDIAERVDEHVDTLAGYWSFIQQGQLPPLTDLDVMELDETHQAWSAAAAEFRAADRQQKAAKAEYEQARQRLINLAEWRRMRGGGVSLTRYLREAPVQYSHPDIVRKLQELPGFPDRYRGESYETVLVRALKGES